MVVYEYGMRGDPDSDLELAEDGGCSGRAFSTGEPAVADLDAAKAEYESWNMTEEQQAKVKQSQSSMVAVPIRASVLRSGQSDTLSGTSPIIATLGIDSSTPLGDTGWVYDDQGLNIDRDLLSFAGAWANVISRVMS